MLVRGFLVSQVQLRGPGFRSAGDSCCMSHLSLSLCLLSQCIKNVFVLTFFHFHVFYTHLCCTSNYWNNNQTVSRLDSAEHRPDNQTHTIVQCVGRDVATWHFDTSWHTKEGVTVWYGIFKPDIDCNAEKNHWLLICAADTGDFYAELEINPFYIHCATVLCWYDDEKVFRRKITLTSNLHLTLLFIQFE